MIVRLAKFVRKALRRAGTEVARHRSLNTALSHGGINLVLDVGANEGQYGQRLRDPGYRARIVSFEPRRTPFAVLTEAARRGGNWQVVNIGSGSAEEPKEINVYEDSKLSSMLTFQQNDGVFASGEVGTETIQIRTLDGILDQDARPGDRILLKIDTQGFEKPVLTGAEQSLPRLAGIQMELSTTPLYAHQPFLAEMIMYLRERDFMLWQIVGGGPILGTTGQELEVDGLFLRAPTPRS